MTSNETPRPAAAVARAAALLDAVARDCESAVDFEVPIRCGQAVNQLYMLLGSTSLTVPYVGDDAEAIRAALSEAITLLSLLPPDEMADAVLDALIQARAAALVAQNGPGR